MSESSRTISWQVREGTIRTDSVPSAPEPVKVQDPFRVPEPQPEVVKFDNNFGANREQIQPTRIQSNRPQSGIDLAKVRANSARGPAMRYENGKVIDMNTGREGSASSREGCFGTLVQGMNSRRVGS